MAKDGRHLRGSSAATGWQSLIVPHKFMGPLPAFFYPVFQLMDYGVHSWDIRQGSGGRTASTADVADLLVPFMHRALVGHRATSPRTSRCEIGMRILSGHNAGSSQITLGAEASSYGPARSTTWRPCSNSTRPASC